VAEARSLIDRSGLAISIEVDGGISPSTAAGARAAGAELFVAGSAILTHPGGKGAAVAELRAALDTPIRRGLESSERRPG
jgi:ribulose-phosphate 3-epimerase